MKRTVLYLLFSLGSCIHVFSQSIVWDGTSPIIHIGESVTTLEDADNVLALKDVIQDELRNEFVKSEKKILNFGFTDSYQWIRFSFENNTDDELVLELAQALLPVVDFYYQSEDGTWKVYYAGYDVQVDDRIIRHHYQVFPLPKGKNEIYVRVLSYVQPIPISIQEEGYFTKTTRNQLLTYGTYVGIILFVILNNLFLYFLLRKFPFLHYSTVAFMHILISAFVMDGYILYVFENIDMIFWYNFIPLASMANTALYAIIFLEVKRFAPRSYKLAIAAFIYFLSYLIWSNFLPVLAVITLNQVHALFNLALVAFLGLRTGYKGNRVGYYFASAYFVYLAIVIVEIFYQQTGSPSYLFKLSHVSIALLIEVLILAFALSKRFEWEREDFEELERIGQEKLVTQTLENERIVKEQNIILEERVKDRTIQLRGANEELSRLLESVDNERQKSESLLLNILPATTARELKELGNAKPQTYQSVTVLFTDFQDFTKITSGMSSEALVNDLNECFSAFDTIVQKNGIEKIKTIGDSYMAAGGIPTPSGLHALDTVRAALAMRDFMKDWNQKRLELNRIPLEIRIGIHSGSVVAGVVGTHKFAYDIWGDTVNIASRIESNGEIGKVNISEAAYSIVKNDFQCSARGMIEVKGRGPLAMYWVEPMQ